MKWSNEELIDYGNEALDYIKIAIDELEGIDEYKEILSTLKQTEEDLKNEMEVYQEEYLLNQQREKDYEETEYRKIKL